MWPFWLGGFPCWVRNETFKAKQLNSSLIVAGMKSLRVTVLLFPNLACDFLGERLAGALGLKAAKYQYAIDQYDRDHKVM